MTLRSLDRFPFGLPKRPARSSRRASLHGAPRSVEVLEDRQLLSTITPTGHPHSAPRSHHHAIIQPIPKSASVPNVTYYNAVNTTDASQLPISGWQGIKAGDTPGQYLISGTSAATGLLYVGSSRRQGTSYTGNYP